MYKRQQHLGAPANPIVQVGDTVKVGQKIGEAAGFISAPVHSSVSGTVVAVEPVSYTHLAGHEAMLGSLIQDGKGAYRMLEESPYKSELGIAFKKGTHEELAEKLTETLTEMQRDVYKRQAFYFSYRPVRQ